MKHLLMFIFAVLAVLLFALAAGGVPKTRDWAIVALACVLAIWLWP